MIFKNKTILSLVAFFAATTCVKASLNSEEEAPQYSWKISTKIGDAQTVDRKDGKKFVTLGLITGPVIKLGKMELHGVQILSPLVLAPYMTLEEATAALRTSGLID